MTTKTLAAAALAATILSVMPALADTQEVRTWYNDGSFVVKEVVAERGPFCVASRGDFSTAAFAVFAAPNYIAFDLIERNQSWTPGQVALIVDGHTWNATATVTADHPDQLWIQPQIGTAQLKAFVSALYNGVTLTIAGNGRPQPFRYEVSLIGSYAALSAARACVDSLIGQTATTPTAVQPVAPAVRRII